MVGPFGLPLPDTEQLEAPWACTGCASRRGFRRRGFRPKPRKVMTACGRVVARDRAQHATTRLRAPVYQPEVDAIAARLPPS